MKAKLVGASLSAVVVVVGALVAPVASGASPSGKDSSWHIGYYTPSNRTLSMAQAKAGSDGSLAVLPFTDQPNTALLLSTQGSSGFLGNDLGKTVSATFSVTGAAANDFMFYPDGGSTPANVRLFFETSFAGGFAYSLYWWADNASYTLGNGTVTISATIGATSPWSDWNGQSNTDPNYFGAFDGAASDITGIGLSFGGGYHYESGVGTNDGLGTLTLTNFSVS